jgi:hypothetical protein
MKKKKISNMNKKDYNYLDDSFIQEKIDIEERFQGVDEFLHKAYPQHAPKKQKHISFSITIPEDNALFVSALRSKIAAPNKNFYPTTSDIFSLGIESLKQLNSAEINELVKLLILN